MSVKQISVFLENKAGSLQRMTGVLAEAGIDMRALTVAEARDFGVARIVVDDTFKAMNALKEASFLANLTPVLGVLVPDEPGGLDKLIRIFSEAQINIEYMYAFMGGKDSKHACMIIRVQDTEAGEQRLSGKGLRLLTQEQLAELVGH
ncbi:MAG TPA: acetolactate synthase [Lachnospiraceae bacterium]|nr:acetolactate synthase [Lachnospiraceae bacterium]